MATLPEILADLDGLLEPEAFADYCPNGLQVQGREQIGRIVSGVSAHCELFARAVELDADLVLTHHGIFWDGDERRVRGPLRDRLRMLLNADVSLLSYHLPLDAHPELGNNALIAKGVGADDRAPFAAHHGRKIGCRATFAGDGVTLGELVERLSVLTGREALVFAGGPERIRSLGVVSGAGISHLGEAIDAGCDAFITGEAAERAPAQASEAGITFIAAGHHATERLGVQALGDHLAERFGVEHRYVEVANPV